jgi:hypothetical protein
MSQTPSQLSNSIPSILVGLLMGIILGGGISSGIWYYVMRQRQAELEALRLAGKTLGLVDTSFDSLTGQINPNANQSLEGSNASSSDSVSKEIENLGKAFVYDLEKNRLAAAYRSTSASYQKKTERKKFDEIIEAVPSIKGLSPIPSSRESKVRKMPGGKQYGYYFTGQFAMNLPFHLVNVALIYAKSEDNEWQIEELEISKDKQDPNR